MAFPHIVSKCFLSSAASVLASTVCIVPLILGSTVARAQEGSMLGAGEIVLAQTRETSPTQKDPMSWKDILGKAGPPVPAPSQEPSGRQPSVSALILPKLSGRVVDQANLLDQATRVMLTDKLAHLEAKTTDQLVVVTLNSLHGTSIEDFGLQLGRHWQIGQRDKNNGVLLIVAPNEHKVPIEVGYGLEDTLTNAIYPPGRCFGKLRSCGQFAGHRCLDVTAAPLARASSGPFVAHGGSTSTRNGRAEVVQWSEATA
jgi:hypothetical protein